MNDVYLIMRNLMYLGTASTCLATNQKIRSKPISNSIHDYIQLNKNTNEINLWRNINLIMKSGLELEYYGLTSIEEFIDIIFSEKMLESKHEDLDGQIISLKDWLLKKPIGSNDYQSNFLRISDFSISWRSNTLSSEEKALIKKWFANDESETGSTTLEGLRNLISENRFQLIRFQNIFDAFQQILKLGSKEAIGSVLKNIKKNRVEESIYPKIGSGRNEYKFAANFINDFFKLWKGVDHNIIQKSNIRKNGERYELFSLNLNGFASPTEAQFIAIDSIIQFFINNLFNGDLAEFNRWNIYASQSFYRGELNIRYSGEFKNHHQLLEEIGTKLTKKELLQKSFFIDNREIIVQANYFFEKDLLDDLEDISDILVKIFAQESFRKILNDDNLVVSYPKSNVIEGTKTILDIGILFNALSQGRGVLFEGLGFTEFCYGKPYSRSHDLGALGNIIEGLAPIYIPYDDQSTRNFYFYINSQNVQYIGKIAPLISRTQFKELLHALLVSGKSFSETILLLSHDDHYKSFGLSKSDAKEIQEAFGLTVNIIDGQYIVVDFNQNPVTKLIDEKGQINLAAVNPNMQKWWQNYANSNLEFINSILNKMYAQLHYSF